MTVMKPTKIVTVIRDLNCKTRSRSCPVALYLVSASLLPFVLVISEVPIKASETPVANIFFFRVVK